MTPEDDSTDIFSECSCSFDTRLLTQALDKLTTERNIYSKKNGRRFRYRPYSIISNKDTQVEKKVDLYYNQLCGIRVNIRHFNFKLNSSTGQISCSIEALIDEISRFTVNKMSALAESMYV